MTLDEAMKLAGGNTAELSDKQLAEMNTALQGEAAKENASDDTKIAAEVAVAEADARLEQLGRLDSYAIGDLDNIISLAGSVSGFSQNADLAKSVLEKATQQKASLTPEQLNEAALDGIINDSSYTEEEKEVALEAAMQYNEELRTNAQNETPAAPAEKPELTPQQLNEAAFDEILNSDQYTDEEKEMALDAGIEYNKELDEKDNKKDPEYAMGDETSSEEAPQQEENLEATQESTENAAPETPDTPAQQNEDDNETETADEEQLQAGENIPEEQAALEAFDKEYGIDTMTEEQLNKNAEFMDEMDRTFEPFARDGQGNLVHPEFQEEFDAYQNMVITDDQGNPLSEEEQKKAKEALKETAMFEAGMLVRGCAKGDSLETQYKEALKSSLQRAAVSVGFAAEIAGKPLDRETIGAAFAKAAAQEGGIRATQTGITAYAGNTSGEMTKLRDRLKNKFKEIPAVQKMSAKIAAFDKSMDDRYGKKWKVAKRIGNIIAKRAKSVAIYTAIGAVAGSYAPLAMAGLAVKSGYDACKGIQKKAAANGMGFWEYARSHKGEVAMSMTTSGLAIAGSALGLGESGRELAPALKTATRVLAIAPNAAKAAFHGIKAFAIKKGWAKGNAEEELQAAKESWDRTVDATIGMIAGAALNEGIQEMRGDEPAPENDTPAHDAAAAAQQMSPDEMASALEHMGLSPDVVDSMDPIAMQRYIDMHPQDFQDAQMMMQDKDHDGKPDYMDPDHGEGWAKANETQLDRAMDADPKGINEILNDGKWHSSAELKEMMEKGQFNDDQLKAIHDLAVREFDENGKIIDGDLKAYYEKLAKEAADNELKADPDKLRASEDEINKPDISNQPARGEPELTPAEQKMYDAILNTIGKNEDMTNPEIRASVEGLARQQFEDARAAIIAGDDAKAADIIYGVHAQGEKGELETATKHEEGDSRRVINAKDGLVETKEKLDAAKEALAQDPDNEKLQKEVAKLEKEFDKDSIKLDNREIKQERSDLKDEIKQDKEALKSYDKARETIEKNVGLSSAEVDKQLAAAGIDVNNLPKDVENLPDNVKNLIGAHNLYDQVDKNQEELKQRIADNEKAREDLKDQRHDNKEELRNVKKGNGLSDEAEERLAGQSQFGKSELVDSLAGVVLEQNVEQGVLQEAQINENPLQDKPAEAPVYEDNSAKLQAQQEVDKFLADEVAKGNMTAEEAKEMAPLLVAKAEAEHLEEQAKEADRQPAQTEKSDEKPVEKTETLTKEQEDQILKDQAMMRAQMQANSIGLKPGTEAYDKFMADKEANYEASKTLREDLQEQSKEEKAPEQTQEKADDKVVAPAPEIAEKISTTVNKAESFFLQEISEHSGGAEKLIHDDGSTEAKYTTNDGTVRSIVHDVNGGATISAYSMTGDGYKLKLEADGTSISSKTDIYGVQTTETKDPSGKIIESHQETKTMEEKLAFREGRLNSMKQDGFMTDKEVKDAMEASRKELMAEKAKELSGRGDVSPTKPVQQTKLDLTNAGKGKSLVD